MDNAALWKTVVLREAEQFWQNNKYLASVSEMAFVALTVLSACDLMHFIPVSLANKIVLPSSSLKTAGAANKAQFHWFQNLSGVLCSEMRFFVLSGTRWDFQRAVLSLRGFICPCSNRLEVCCACPCVLWDCYSFRSVLAIPVQVSTWKFTFGVCTVFWLNRAIYQKTCYLQAASAQRLAAVPFRVQCRSSTCE